MAATVEDTLTACAPAFMVVVQTSDLDEVFACAAMLSGKKIEEIRAIDIAGTKHPERGPYYFGETQIAALLAERRLVATGYREVGYPISPTSLP